MESSLSANLQVFVSPRFHASSRRDRSARGRLGLLWAVLAAAAVAFLLPSVSLADSGKTTRITSPDMHARKGADSYPYRTMSDYVLSELDLKPGDVVVDIGSGDGWWSERMAGVVGEAGVVHAAEVAEKKVDGMRKKFAGVRQIRPYLCETDSTRLPENSCDLAFFSQSYHHLNHENRVEYLRHLRKVLRPTGRIVVIERYPVVSTNPRHGTKLSVIAKEAADAGWVLVRFELMVGTYHYLAVLVQKDLFPPEPKKRQKKKRLRI